MRQIQDYIVLTTTNDNMFAMIDVAKEYNHTELEVDKEAIIQFLQDNKIIYGIDDNAIETFISAKDDSNFPLTIAEGQPAENGVDGYIHYEISFEDNEIRKTPEWNFRDVMRIPSVTKGQLLAALKLPTEGKDGINVFGKTVQARPGKPCKIKAGKNVVFHEEELSFYAEAEGQFSATDRMIQVFDVFEVNEDLSMKNGNLDFVGSIMINGDVPTGYTVKAKGDIRIFGMVEAATIAADGSVYISEGMSGLQKGLIKAGENVHIGYINQGTVYAGNDINVENSVLHSEITARHQVFCQRGNIIGGSVSAGERIEAKDTGNRLNTKTEIILGFNKATAEKEKIILAKKEELLSTMTKLKTISDKMEGEPNQDDPKLKVTMLRIKNSYNKTMKQLQEIEDTLKQLNPYLGSERDAQLIVRGHLYPNVLIAFGKYKRKIETNHQYVKIKLDYNEVTVRNIN
ncbi:DUF342 domain-containing protein [Virgibacillus doumboii]|uniref:DUF342 domain-containing protein n=1 Tax=Virgibacillus doumboii TaxID=2697503 RepID=UPI0013E04BC7|nr:FapA family protein [Virgibacillus doumboii]